MGSREHTGIASSLFCVSVMLAWTGVLGYADYDITNVDYMKAHRSDEWNSVSVRPFSQRQCIPIPPGMTLCSNVGYQNMSLPNMLGHDTVKEVVGQAEPWVYLRNVGCHHNTELFLCSLYAPVCLERPIFPCQGLCNAVKESCGPYLYKYGFSWPEILKCDKFPQDDGLCIKELNVSGETAANVCPACKQPSTFESLLDSYCWASFVIKVRIRKVVHDELGDKKLVTKGKLKFYKPKSNTMTKEEIRAISLTITDGASCECDAVTKPAKSTLIMGSKQGSRYVITYVSDWSNKKEFKRAIRAIRKGHDCKKQIEEIAGQTDGGLNVGGKQPQGGDVNINIGPGVTPDTIGGGKPNRSDRKKGSKEDRKENKTKRRKKKGKKDNKISSGKDSKPADPMQHLSGIYCVQCRQPLVYDHLISLYCSANFVLKFKVGKIKLDGNGDTKLISKKLNSKDFFRQEGLSKRDLRKLQPVIDGSNSCDCESAAKGKSLLIMGQKKGGRDVITYVSEMVRDIQFKKFTRAIRKGFDCASLNG